MCGIAGIFVDDLPRAEIECRLSWMNDAMAHRGPDDAGMVAEDGAGLAMRRLAIIDIDGGRQPVANESATISLVMNGEIYNYRELGARLRRKGHKIHSASDTEVAVHAFEDAPDAFPSDLRGMFALAAWDRSDGSVTLAVDRLGIKPLYYVADSERLVFASEMGSLLAAGLCDSEIDMEAVGQYFAYGYIVPPLSIFRGVSRLLPGHILKWSRSRGPRTYRYWDVPAASVAEHLSSPDLSAQLIHHLSDAVRSHLVSDVPVGVFLSGGVDSSTLVALMSEADAGPVRTFSVGFADREHNELDAARKVARRFATDHQEFVLEPAAVEVVSDIVRHFGEPFADPAALPTYFLSRVARDHVKVALSGDGADELFLGYTVFRGLDLARRMQVLPASVREAVWRSVGRAPRTGLPRWDDRIQRVTKRIEDSMLSPRDAYRSKCRPYGGVRAVACLSGDVQRAISAVDPFAPFEKAFAEAPTSTHSDPLEPFVYTGIKVSLPADILVKVDRMSMANSLEVRVPFLDHKLVEFVAGLPIRQRYSRHRLKSLLRDAMRGKLPDDILDRPKHGFTIPLSAWLRGDLTGYAADVLLSGEARRSGYYDSNAVALLLSEHRDNRLNLSGAIWMLLVFELWRSRSSLAMPT